MKLVTITMTAHLPDDSPLCTEENIAGVLNFNLLVGALTQVCDLLSGENQHPPDTYTQYLRIKKLEAALCKELVHSAAIQISEQPKETDVCNS